MNIEEVIKVVWPFPVRVMEEKPQTQESIAVKVLSGESKKELWAFLCKEEPFLAGFLKQLRVAEERQEEAGIPEDKILRFDTRVTLLGQGASLQKKIMEREKSLHSNNNA